MESNFRNRDFEEYVQQNADQYRMFPSEKVWKNIHGTLHTRRKWYGFGLALLLLSTVTAVTWVMVSYPASKTAQITDGPAIQQTTPVSQAPSPVTSSAMADNTNLPFSIKQVIVPSSAKPKTITTAAATPATIASITEETTVQSGSSTDLMNQRPQLSTTVIAPRIATGKPANAAVITAPSFTEQPLIVDQNTDALTEESANKTTVTTATLTRQEDIYPLTIESVTNEYKRKARRRLDVQFYVTPTISYRRLAVNKSLEHTGIVGAGNNYTALADLEDVNKFVTHKPDMGVQVGLSGSYAIAKNIRLRGGVQLNISRYDVKASLNNPVQASYDLATSGGNVSPFKKWTYYRNNGGIKSDWLKNYYISVSVPIGLEMKLFGSDKTNVGIAGTIQPTYTIKNRAYMISTDYKNYATIPFLMRHVNVSTGFEAFVNYSTGGARWQIGPQVRYQILSSFNNKYPVKENLFDFGMKIGVSLNQ